MNKENPMLDPDYDPCPMPTEDDLNSGMADPDPDAWLSAQQTESRVYSGSLVDDCLATHFADMKVTAEVLAQASGPCAHRWSLISHNAYKCDRCGIVDAGYNNSFTAASSGYYGV